MTKQKALAIEMSQAIGAVAAMSLSTLLQNGYVLPDVQEPLPSIFLIFGTLHAIAFALWAAFAFRCPKALSVNRVTAFSAVALAVGGLLWLFSRSEGFSSAPITLIATSLISIGRSWAIIVSGLFITRFGARRAIVAIALGVSLSYGLFVIAPFAWEGAPLASYILSPLTALLLVSQSVAQRRSERPDPASSPNELSVTNPSSFPGLGSQVFVCIALFEIAFGLSVRFGVEGLSVGQNIVVGIALGGVALWCYLTKNAEREDSLFRLSGLLVIFGFLTISATTAIAGYVSRETLAIGSQAFSVLTWTTLATMASRNPVGEITLIGQGFCASHAGATAGVILGQLSTHLQTNLPDIALIAAAITGTAFVGYIWIGLRSFSFTSAIQGVRPAEDVIAPTVETGIEERCSHLAKVHGLTERESEVFVLLARGRNGAFIQDEYRITRNTAKTHIRHVYQKLNVHTQQELIDLVESGNDYLTQ